MRRALLWIALPASVWLAVFADKSSGPEMAQSIRPPAGSAAVSGATAPQTQEPGVPNADEQLLALVPRTQQTRIAANSQAAMFGQKSWAPPPPPPSPVKVDTKPTAPPVPYQYVGKKWHDGQWTIFLAREDATHLVKIGDVLDDMYRVQSIDASLLVLNYLPLKVEQTIPLD